MEDKVVKVLYVESLENEAICRHCRRGWGFIPVKHTQPHWNRAVLLKSQFSSGVLQNLGH